MNLIAINKAKCHAEKATDLLSEILADEAAASGGETPGGVGGKMMEAELNSAYKQIEELEAENIALRRDFSRFLADMKNSAGGQIKDMYCAYFQKHLIDSIWRAHGFDIEFDGSFRPGGRLIDIPLTFSNIADEEGMTAAEFHHGKYFKSDVAYDAIVWMDEDSAGEFLYLIRNNWRVNFWTMAREGEGDEEIQQT